MKKYDFDKAKKLIQEAKQEDLIFAEMGMKEDWEWTSERVWSPENGFSMPFFEKTIGGITGSAWATPILRLYFKNKTKSINCYFRIEDNFSKETIKEMKSFAKITGGGEGM